MKTIIVHRNLKSQEYPTITEAFEDIAKRAKCDPRDIHMDGFGPSKTARIWIAGRNLRSPIALKANSDE